MDRKVLERVFDKPTLMAILSLFNKGIFREFGSPVADGKEARVFTARNDEELIVKIYKVETSAFETLKEYIRGDPRFWNIGSNRRSIIKAWVKKEFGNLRRLYEAGVSCPKPYAFANNIVVMQFIGKDIPAPQIKDVELESPEETLWAIADDLKKAYGIAKIVHADISEYNILFWEGKHYIIDVGQAVDIRHPMSEEYLKRDVKNLCRFFSKWTKVKPAAILKHIKTK